MESAEAKRDKDLRDAYQDLTYLSDLPLEQEEQQEDLTSKSEHAGNNTKA